MLSQAEIERAKEGRELADVYVRSAERYVDFEDKDFSELLDVTSDLSESEKQTIEWQEGMRPEAPSEPEHQAA